MDVPRDLCMVYVARFTIKKINFNGLGLPHLDVQLDGSDRIHGFSNQWVYSSSNLLINGVYWGYPFTNHIQIPWDVQVGIFRQILGW